MTPAFSSLLIKDLSLRVRLGCSAEERAVPQEVRIGVEIQFHKNPRGMISDRLEDTICYSKISTAFRDWCKSREFALVEKLSADLFAILREISGDAAQIVITIHKVSPPIDGLMGGVVCRVGDFA